MFDNIKLLFHDNVTISLYYGMLQQNFKFSQLVERIVEIGTVEGL
jgi:hypothetical protein